MPGLCSPRLHPRRLLDGVIEGVKDGGNKSGVPTIGGTLYFDAGYLGKCLVFVGALGLLPKEVKGEPAAKKAAHPGDLIIVCGGRVGQDGIHGVTASSEVASPGTPAGHVQIGDPYTQKNMQDFLQEARDQGLITFITDCGGGGLSSAVGESAMMAGGCEVDLSQVPLKYQGLDPWEIWISESQERMVVAVRPENEALFKTLARKHAVEATVIGAYTDRGVLEVQHQGRTCAHMDFSLLDEEFPPWEFDCEWLAPAGRLSEPVLGDPADSSGTPPDHAGAPQYLRPGVDHPPVRPRSPGGQHLKTPGGPGGEGSRGRRGDPAPAGIPPGPRLEPGPQPGLLPDRHLPHGRGHHR